MVSCRLTGGLGNLLYIMAATVAYAKKWNMPYVIPTKTTNPRWKHYKFPGIHYEDIDTTGFFHYREPAINYSQRPYDITVQDIPYHKNIVLEGHFLSHKYFWDYKDEIFEALGFVWHPNGDMIGVHQRCGDYRTMEEYLPIAALGYYQRAVEYAVKKTKIKKIAVYGDEPDFNKERFTFDYFPKIEGRAIISGNDEIKDLQYLSSHPVIICGNSTYALWASYLNQHPNKLIICPEKWHGVAFGEVNKKDMYPPNAIIL